MMMHSKGNKCHITTSLSTVILSVSLVSLILQPVNAQSVETYENKMFGLKLTYPSDWYITTDKYYPPGQLGPGGQAAVGFEPTGKNEEDALIYINMVRDLLTGNNAEEYARDQMKYMDEVLGHGPIMIDGKAAYALSGIDEDDGKKEWESSIFIKLNNIYYSFDAYANSENAHLEILPIFKRMMDSVQVTGTTRDIGQGGQPITIMPPQVGSQGQFNPFGPGVRQPE